MAARFPPEDIEKIKEVHTKYEQAWLKGDANGVRALFTEDCVLLPPHGDTPWIGQKGLNEYWFPSNAPATQITKLVVTPKNIGGAGQIGHVAHARLEPGADAARVASAGDEGAVADQAGDPLALLDRADVDVQGLLGGGKVPLDGTSLGALRVAAVEGEVDPRDADVRGEVTVASLARGAVDQIVGTGGQHRRVVRVHGDRWLVGGVGEVRGGRATHRHLALGGRRAGGQQPLVVDALGCGVLVDQDELAPLFGQNVEAVEDT